MAGFPIEGGAAARQAGVMYPPVKQFETRHLELERDSTRHPEREHHATRRREPKRRRDHRASAGRPYAGAPRYKLALLTWAGAYAVITPVLALLGPEMASWPLVLRTLVLSVTMVVSLTWLIMPRLTRMFRGWLTASPT
jgi:hypothetical protein